jgi:hypothetical protein
MNIEQISAMCLMGILSNPKVFESFEQETMVHDVVAASIVYAKELQEQLMNDNIVDAEFEIITD